jgi:hypothetical protein
MKTRFCDGISRRDLLSVGNAALFGTAWNIPDLLQAQEHGVAADDKDDVSLIVVFLRGGPSTIDMFDMKPNAPLEVRGEFSPISTNVPGIQLTEHMPLTARQQDKFSLIRSFTHPNSSHGLADHYMLTGYHPTPAFNPKLLPNNERPSHGSIISKVKQARGSVPPYVCLPEMHKSAGAAYLGPNAAPFVIQADPNAPDFAVPDLLPPLVIDPTRLDARAELRAQLGRFEHAAEEAHNRKANSFSVFREKAVTLMASAEAKRAFNIDAESTSVRDEYGRTTLGQSCLMARRLVEAGVRCVTIQHVDWDTHQENFRLLKDELLPALDAAMATLFKDLADRGMLEKTMVVVTGEFGRTPKIDANASAGRGHWGPAFTVAIGGGGIQGGRVIGKTDAHATKPIEDPHGPENLAATIHRQMGIDPDGEFHSAEGRPFKIVNDGKVIWPLL